MNHYQLRSATGADLGRVRAPNAEAALDEIAHRCGFATYADLPRQPGVGPDTATFLEVAPPPFYVPVPVAPTSGVLDPALFGYAWMR